MTELFDEWNARLEAEGLGVIARRRNWDDACKDIKPHQRQAPAP